MGKGAVYHYKFISSNAYKDIMNVVEGTVNVDTQGHVHT